MDDFDLSCLNLSDESFADGIKCPKCSNALDGYPRPYIRDDDKVGLVACEKCLDMSSLMRRVRETLQEIQENNPGSVPTIRDVESFVDGISNGDCLDLLLCKLPDEAKRAAAVFPGITVEDAEKQIAKLRHRAQERLGRAEQYRSSAARTEGDCNSVVPPINRLFDKGFNSKDLEAFMNTVIGQEDEEDKKLPAAHAEEHNDTCNSSVPPDTILVDDEEGKNDNRDSFSVDPGTLFTDLKDGPVRDLCAKSDSMLYDAPDIPKWMIEVESEQNGERVRINTLTHCRFCQEQIRIVYKLENGTPKGFCKINWAYLKNHPVQEGTCGCECGDAPVVRCFGGKPDENSDFNPWTKVYCVSPKDSQILDCPPDFDPNCKECTKPFRVTNGYGGRKRVKIHFEFLGADDVAVCECRSGSQGSRAGKYMRWAFVSADNPFSKPLKEYLEEKRPEKKRSKKPRTK